MIWQQLPYLIIRNCHCFHLELLFQNSIRVLQLFNHLKEDSMAVTNQPGPYAPSDFQTGICDFCSDCGTCFKALCCLPCTICSITSDLGECCCFGYSFAIRSVYRTRYNINGSMCGDLIAYCCCPMCATCQLKRDIDLRKEQGIF